MQNAETKMPYSVLLIICISSFITPFMASSFNLAMPDIAKAFSFNAVMLTWFTTSYLISTAIFQIPLARVADIVGRKKIFLVSLLGIAFTTILSPFAPNGAGLIALRVFAGIFSAMLFSTSMAILVASVSPAGRAKALAINVAFVYSALAIGPFIGGMLTHYAGWQSIFYVSGGLMLVIFILAKLFLKGEWIVSKGERFDYIGSIVYAFAIVGISYGFSSLAHTKGIFITIAGLIFFIVFVIYEKKCRYPVFNISLFSANHVFAFASLAALINYAANSAIVFMMSLYLQYIRGFEPSTAGLILMSQAGVQVVAALMTGRLSAKYSPANISTLGISISAIGLFGLIFIAPTTPIYIIILMLMILGCGFGLFSSPNTNIIMSSVDKQFYGQASATTGTMRLTGQSFSMGIAAMVISFYMGTSSIVPELYPQFMSSIKMVCLIFAVICTLGVYASAKTK